MRVTRRKLFQLLAGLPLVGRLFAPSESAGCFYVNDDTGSNYFVGVDLATGPDRTAYWSKQDIVDWEGFQDAS